MRQVWGTVGHRWYVTIFGIVFLVCAVRQMGWKKTLVYAVAAVGFLLIALCVVTVMIASPWWYKRQHDRHFRSLHVVEEGVLYRSGQLDLDGLKTLLRDYRIKTIISLRDTDDPD